MKYIVAVSFKIDDSHEVLIYPSGTKIENDLVIEEKDNYTLLEKESEEKLDVYFDYKTTNQNINFLRLKETKRYCCKVTNCTQEVYPNIKNEDNKFLKIEHEDDRIIFQYINYLGKSYICFGEDKSKRIEFEVVPEKMDYDKDYVELTKAIADECSALLLDYSSPTSLTFTQDTKRESNVLEQFIFLRTFCYSDNIESLFASIKRNPDRILVKEDDIKPFGTGMPSAKFFSNPFSNSRGWVDLGNGNYLPSEISVTHKYDSYDTPANRFIKFALNDFNEIAGKVIKYIDSESNINGLVELRTEAQEIENKINDILCDSFFDDVSELQLMPVNNQVLEKREGYNQIFKAFSMVDLALKLEWEGKDDIYNGEAKNTALLYEYWLFFELRKILHELKCKDKDTSELEPYNQFVTDKNGLNVSLQQGVTSVQSFEFEEQNLKVNLYYNRTFSPLQFNSTVYWGSYSRIFRPDYTIAIFSKDYKKEKDAIKDGNVSYIHFDAKYRIQDLKQFIKPDKQVVGEETLEEVETEITEDETKEIQDEKIEANINTYKRGDLLVMHTYKDAIRRTVGSYVLYPGSDTDVKEKKQPSVYDEILPGVGAFAIRPEEKTIEGEKLNPGHEAVKEFIKQIISFKSQEASRQFRKDYFENMVIYSPSIENKSLTSDNEEYQMIGFIRDEYYKFLYENHFIPHGDEPLSGKEWPIYFYFYAIKDGKVYTIHKETTKAKYLRLTRTDLNTKEKEFDYKFQKIEPWEAEIDSIELVSKETLKQRMNDLYKLEEKKYEFDFNADFYYLVKANIVTTDVDSGITGINTSENEAISIHSPKIVERIIGNKTEK